MRCDTMIKGWLTISIVKDIRSSMKYANTTSDIWSDREERLGKEGAPQAYELKQSFTTTRQEGSSISSYYTKLRSIWDEIQSTTPIPLFECVDYTYDMGKRLNESKDKERLYVFRRCFSKKVIRFL